jgi:mannose-6-phosphate isomerase-like protein (cupin superfamily)
MTTEQATKAQFFSLKTPYLSDGRSDTTVAKTDMLTARIKVYHQGGENSLHRHSREDHSFVVLEGQATFYDENEEPTVVNQYQGIMLPRGTFYRFHSSGATNLVLLRFGTGKQPGNDDRMGPDGKPLPGGSVANKHVNGVPIPGQFFGG